LGNYRSPTASPFVISWPRPMSNVRTIALNYNCGSEFAMMNARASDAFINV
jgi:hypothetical protein